MLFVETIWCPTDQGSIFSLATGGLPHAKLYRQLPGYYFLNTFFFFFFLRSLKVWLIPGLWELVSDYVTLKWGMNNIWLEPDWINFGQRSYEDLATQLFMYPWGQADHFASQVPNPHKIQPIHLHLWPRALHLHYAPWCWPPASHCPASWTLP